MRCCCVSRGGRLGRLRTAPARVDSEVEGAVKEGYVCIWSYHNMRSREKVTLDCVDTEEEESSTNNQ